MPEGWTLRPFEEVAHIRQGLVDPKSSEFSDHLHIGPDSIDGQSGCVIADLRSVGELGLISGKFLFQPDDILYSKIRPNLNKVARAKHVGLCSADMYAVIPNGDDLVDRDFLLHTMRGERFYKEAVACSMRSGLPKVNRDDLSYIIVACPPLPEQRRIAAVLNTWDEAIATAERLKAYLLRAKLSLQGTLVGEGDDTMLSDMAHVAFSGVDKRITAGERPVRLCNYMDVLRNRRLRDSIEFSAGTATRAECHRFSLRRDDVVFTKDSETAGEIAEASYVADDVANVVCGYHLAIARPKPGFSGAYLSHAMRVPQLRQQFVVRANGAIRFGLTLDAIQQVRLPAPPLERQIAIAAALDHAEDEAESYEAMAGLLRRQKRGLMQKLLTGEWRVPALGDAFAPGGPAADRLEAAE